MSTSITGSSTNEAHHRRDVQVREWRTGVETDLSEVLQIESVFLNVSKGQVAPSSDLEKAFSTSDVSTVVMEILKKGELQVGEKERQHELEDTRREVANLVAERCVDPKTDRPHTVSMIEKAMEAVHFSVNPSKSSKSQVGRCPSLAQCLTDTERLVLKQALELIKTLSASPDIISLARAQMRVRLTMPTKDAKRLKSKIEPLATKVEEDELDGEGWEWVRL